jgi:benzoate/toluate 1,2-dioxygenase reductase component
MAAEEPAGASRGRLTLTARIERIHDHSADTRSLFLTLIDGRHLRFLPGQFISISIPLGDETRTRAYSIATSPENRGPFEICFNTVKGGRGVGWLFERKVGDTLEFTGPFGTFSMERAPEVEIGLIAEGTAIAPIRPIIRRTIETGVRAPIHLIYGADRDEHILYRDELNEAANRAPNFSYEIVIAPAERLYERLGEIARQRWITADNDRTRQFWICGVGAGVIKLRDLLRGAGYERRAVHYEQW